MPMPWVLIELSFLQAPPTVWELVCCQVSSHSTTEWLVVSIETQNLNQKHRSFNNTARKNREHRNKVRIAREHVFNLTPDKLSDNDYLLLARGLKFVPSPTSLHVKQQIMRDFNEFARKLKCRYMFYDQNNDNNIHPFAWKVAINLQWWTIPYKTILTKQN